MEILGPGGEIELLADLPIIRDRSLAWVDGRQLPSLLRDAIQGRPVRATVERVAAMPCQGVSSMFTFGLELGSVLGVLQVLYIGIKFVTPPVWKLALGSGKDKRASLSRARPRR